MKNIIIALSFLTASAVALAAPVSHSHKAHRAKHSHKHAHHPVHAQTAVKPSASHPLLSPPLEKHKAVVHSTRPHTAATAASK
jgi:hypothetical protein